MFILSKFNSGCNKLCEWLLIAAVAVMVVAITLQVFYRYVLGDPLIWSEEMARYCLVLVTFLGGAVAYRYEQLANITIFVEMFNRKVINVIYILVQFLILGIVVLVGIFSIQYIFSRSIMLQVSPALRMPMFVVYSVIPLFCLFTVTNAIEKIALTIKKFKEDG